MLHLRLLQREEILYLTVSPQLAAVLDKAIQIMQMVVLAAAHGVVEVELLELGLVDKATTVARVGQHLQTI